MEAATSSRTILRPFAKTSEPAETERLAALEASLRERERDLEEAHRIARLGTWRWVKATDDLTWSPEVYRIYGCDPSLPPPRHDAVRKLMSAESFDQILAAIQHCFATGEPYALDLQVTHISGEPRWVVARGEVAERGIDGEVTVLRGTVQDITERKLHEQQLALSETAAREASDRLQAVLDSMTDGLAMIDKEWRYTYLSDQGARLVGIRPEELVGRVLWEVFPETDPLGFGASFRQAVATGKPTHVAGYYPEPLNKWIECHTYPTEEGLSIYFRDISDLKQAEAAIRDSQSRFQRLYDANLMGICYPDKFGAFYDGNDEFLRITGYTREDLAAGLVRWDTMTPPEYAELDRRHIAEAAERGSCTPYEKEYLRKDGTRVPILCGYALLEGSESHYIGFITDLSAQKRAELAVREQERHFRELAESLPELVWAVDLANRSTYLNRRFTEYTGKTLEQLRDGAGFSIAHPDERERARDLWMRSMQTGEPFACELRLQRHDGVYRHFLSRAVPVRNADGEIQRWIGTATDVHDQQMAEEALRRTEKLAATGRLAASIAHEINNPLEAVMNALYLALQMEPKQEVRTYLDLAEQELARVAQVTAQTLRFHRQPSAAEVCDLAEVLESAVALFLPRFQSAGVVVERDYRPHEKVNCYSDELRQVFVNLLGNALDAMRKGGRVRLCVRPSTVFDGVRITIADTGHGIPEDLRTQVFEAFLSTKQDTGTGLGLWVSEGIVRKHKGRIALRSRTTEPTGTVFSIFLPYKGVELARMSPVALRP
jgi:PAS domain S-box-containing protein